VISILKPNNLPDEVWEAYKFLLGVIDEDEVAANLRLLNSARAEVLDILVKQMQIKRVYTTGKQGTKQTARGFMVSQQQKQYRRTLSAHGFLPFEIPYMGMHRKIKDKGKEYNPVGNFNLVLDFSGSTFGTKTDEGLFKTIAEDMGIESDRGHLAEIQRATFIIGALTLEEAKKAGHRFTLLVTPSDVVNKRKKHICNGDEWILDYTKDNDTTPFNVFSHGSVGRAAGNGNDGGISDYIFYKDSRDYISAISKLLEMKYGNIQMSGGDHYAYTSDDWQAVTLALTDICQSTCRLARGTTIIVTDMASCDDIERYVSLWRQIYRDSDIYMFHIVGASDKSEMATFRHLPDEEPMFDGKYYTGMGLGTTSSAPSIGLRIETNSKWVDSEGEGRGLSSGAAVTFEIIVGSGDMGGQWTIDIPENLPFNTTIPIKFTDENKMINNMKQFSIIDVHPASLMGMFKIVPCLIGSRNRINAKLVDERGDCIVKYVPIPTNDLGRLMLEVLSAIHADYNGMIFELPVIIARR